MVIVSGEMEARLWQLDFKRSTSLRRLVVLATEARDKTNMAGIISLCLALSFYKLGDSFVHIINSM